MEQSNGGITAALGIVLSFALAFVGQWALADGAWQFLHLIPGSLFALGVLTLLGGLILSFSNPHSRQVAVAAAIGIVLVLGGFAATVTVEAHLERAPDDATVKRLMQSATHEVAVVASPHEVAERMVLLRDRQTGALSQSKIYLVRTGTGWRVVK